MSKGMYCSASHWIDSASSSWRHRRKLDLLDDDRVAGQRGRVVGVLDLGLVVQAVDRVHHQRRVHDRAVHDRLGRQRLDAQALQVELPLALAQLDQLDGRAADVQTDHAFLGREKSTFQLPQSPTFKATYRVLLKASLEATSETTPVSRRPCIYGYIVQCGNSTPLLSRLQEVFCQFLSVFERSGGVDPRSGGGCRKGKKEPLGRDILYM